MLREVLLRFRELDSTVVRGRVWDLLGPGPMLAQCLACLRDPGAAMAEWCVAGDCVHLDPLDVRGVLAGKCSLAWSRRACDWG
jgi:hypothetical protein